ncbi:MAG TPA: hypothetical protein VJ783_03755, partial [Pirellulales bacterium]|nr:hypothetical protein [Pirellulales bacterium]
MLQQAMRIQRRRLEIDFCAGVCERGLMLVPGAKRRSGEMTLARQGIAGRRFAQLQFDACPSNRLQHRVFYGASQLSICCLASAIAVGWLGQSL